jgi:hypothetical protein
MNSTMRYLDLEFIAELQAFLYDLQTSGYLLGPHLQLLARPLRCKDPSDLQVDWDNYKEGTDLNPPFDTVGGFFRLPSKSQRGYYDSSIEALVLSYVKGTMPCGPVPREDDAVSESPSKCCGRCAKPTRRKAFGTCTQVYLNGALLNGGICNNCLVDGNAQYCSFRRKF